MINDSRFVIHNNHQYLITVWLYFNCGEAERSVYCTDKILILVYIGVSAAEIFNFGLIMELM